MIEIAKIFDSSIASESAVFRAQVQSDCLLVDKISAIIRMLKVIFITVNRFSDNLQPSKNPKSLKTPLLKLKHHLLNFPIPATFYHAETTKTPELNLLKLHKFIGKTLN